MTKILDYSQKLKLWTDFCDDNGVLQKSVPLFSQQDMRVETQPYGLDHRLILKRSEEMEALVIEQAEEVINDYKHEMQIYDGLIYMMYWLDQGIIQPLYIGKAEKIGRKGGLSINIANIRHNKSNFCRWGSNYQYHIGDLSAATIFGHNPKNVNRKYLQWAEKLFLDHPTFEPVLRQPTFFWMKAWPRRKIGIWKEYGITSLTFLEYLLIGVASDIFPTYLLNTEGVNRRSSEI
ncbi:hypothetical protein F8S13_01210 [Chloroflexia bacterium SDU3-3]|nr:hypothetical protein F8S13_01210 [Chloroflexia bacterium SDU3-3]